MKNNDELTLFYSINSAKASLISAVTQIMEKTKLPSCIMDGVISDVLADIRKQEIYDMDGLSRMDKEINKKVTDVSNREVIKDDE